MPRSHPLEKVRNIGIMAHIDAGKTTTTAKLAGYMKKFHSKRPLLAACDVYRPAAIEQLKVVGGQLGLPVFEEGQGDPVKIAENALRYAKDHGNDLVFLDTAGRLHVDEALMDELKRMKAAVHPNEILLVVDAMTGQDAVNAASAFDEALGIDGVVLTKLDGDARGVRQAHEARVRPFLDSGAGCRPPTQRFEPGRGDDAGFDRHRRDQQGRRNAPCGGSLYQPPAERDAPAGRSDGQICAAGFFASPDSAQALENPFAV